MFNPRWQRLSYQLAFRSKPACRSISQLGESVTFMQGDVIGFIAFDCVLRFVGARVMSIAFVVDVPGVHFDDPAADAAGFGIPAHVIADLEVPGHRRFAVTPSAHQGRRLILPTQRRRRWLGADCRTGSDLLKQPLLRQQAR